MYCNHSAHTAPVLENNSGNMTNIVQSNLSCFLTVQVRVSCIHILDQGSLFQELMRSNRRRTAGMEEINLFTTDVSYKDVTNC